MLEQDKEKLLGLLNRFTRRTHTLDEVYLFDVILCDNEIDRDGDCFSDAALDALAKQFIGVTGIFDHNPKAGGQNARIFNTAVCTDETRKTKDGRPYRCLKANAYMVRTDSNADLIREIDAGIKKEVSVSCAVSVQACSVCGANRLKKPCGHIKGKRYGGQVCHTVLDGITDVYEWSFVAVPAQRGAGVTKTCGGSHCDAEKDALRSALLDMSELVGEMTDELRRDVVRLCFAQGESPCAKALADSADTLTARELLALRKSLRDAVQPAYAQANTPQLVQPQDSAKNSPYRMNGGQA